MGTAGPPSEKDKALGALLRHVREGLGLSQASVAQRAVEAGEMVSRATFTPLAVSRAERGIGLRSADTRSALASGMGLSLEHLASLLTGRITPDTAISLSSIRPDPAAVEAIKARAERARKRPASEGSTEEVAHLRAEIARLKGEVARRDDLLAALYRERDKLPEPEPGSRPLPSRHPTQKRAKR